KELLHALFRPAASRGARVSPPRPDPADLVPIDEDEAPPPRPVDRPRPSRSEAETRSEKDSKPDRQAGPPSSAERRAAPDRPRSGRRPARRKLRPRKPGYGSNLLVALAVIWVVIIAIGLLIIFLPGDKGTGDTDQKAP